MALALILGGWGGERQTAPVAEAFFPGIGPEVFETGAELPLYVNELTSTKKPAPLDHYQ